MTSSGMIAPGADEALDADEVRATTAELHRVFLRQGFVPAWREYEDIPGRWTLRLWLSRGSDHQPTEIVVYARTQEELRALLPPGLRFTEASAAEHELPGITGVWA